MENKYINLKSLVKEFNNVDLQEKYIKYLCGIDNSSTFHPQEIEGINALLKELQLPDETLNNFLYGYSIPQLGKEFDLLKVSEEKCIDIELKSLFVSEEKIKKQLRQNKHYLKLVSKEVRLFTFVSNINLIYELINNELVLVDISVLKNELKSIESTQINLDCCFEPNRILVSPLNTPQKFIDGEYLLTVNQEKIKAEILEYLSNSDIERFYGLKGSAGTGKTLLIYDIAKQLSNNKRILIVHSGIKCEGHYYLESHLSNIKIVEAKVLKLAEIKGFDIIIIDESQRLYTSIFEKVVRWAIRAKTICIFSYDSSQKMSLSEKNRDIDVKIEDICNGRISELTGKIRTNKKIASFIKCLFDLNKPHKDDYDNVKILYEPNEREAVQIAKLLENEGYTYIAYTPSTRDPGLDYQDYGRNSHRVIGQEFDGVVMVLNHYFEYIDGKLIASKHPNPDYLFTKLLFQGLTRARTRLCLIVTKEDLLKCILYKLY